MMLRTFCRMTKDYNKLTTEAAKGASSDSFNQGLLYDMNVEHRIALDAFQA
jgi:hypothetical protein